MQFSRMSGESEEAAADFTSNLAEGRLSEVVKRILLFCVITYMLVICYF